jgi:glutamyl-tRNA synthetase
MPQWAHFPLILGPNGKLSKRDGAKYGFPVFAMNWTDPKTNELTEGFKEKGFLPEAFINLLALLGWNDGTEQELFSIEELIEKFSIERVHSAGARFDYEKAKWFNHEWIKQSGVGSLELGVKKLLQEKGIAITDDAFLEKVIGLVKDRCTLLPDFYEQSKFFFNTPVVLDVESVKPKWNAEKSSFFLDYITELQNAGSWEAGAIESSFKELAQKKNIKAGELQLPLRIMLVGEKKGPPVFEISACLGKKESIKRIEYGVSLFNS